MKSHIFRGFTSCLLFALSVYQPVSADDPANDAEAPEGKQVPFKTKIAIAIQSLVSDEEAEAKAEPAEAPAEALNLEVLAAPLQVLFGIGGAANGVMAVEIGMPVQADAVGQNDAMIQQFTQQFRPFLTEELGFVRLICSDLSKDQRPKIKRTGEASLKEAATQMAAMQNRQGQVRVLGQPAAVPEPRKMIREAIGKVLRETLTEEQMTKYTREAAERTAQRKQAAILAVVSRLDGCLFLNTRQRDKIGEEISLNWQDKWEQWLMLSSYGDQYFPVVPDNYVVPHLDADQKIVWQGLQKIDFGIWWGGGHQVQVNDGWWGDEAGNVEAPANGAILNFRAIGF